MKLFAPKNEGGWDMRDPGSWWPNIGSVMTNSGKRVSEDSAMTFSAVFAATRIISEAVAGLPLSILEQVDYRTTRKATDHPLWRVLHDIPNPEQDKVTWFDMQTAFLPTWGNCFAEKQVMLSGELAALWPIHPSRIPLRNITRNPTDPSHYHTIVVGQPGEIVFWVKNDDGSVTPIEAASMLHVPGVMSSNGITGQSIIRWAANSIGIGMATEEHAGALFKNGAVTNMVIKSPKTVGKETAERLRQQWQSCFWGVANHYKTLLLEDGMEAVPISMNPEDTQLILARQFSVSEIARWWKVPPHMLGDLSRSTFSNIEQQYLEFIVHSLGPWVQRWEAAMFRQLLTPEEQKRYRFKFNMNAMLRGDSAARSAFYTSLFGMGVVSPNDIRELEDWNPVDGGDQRFIPANNFFPLEKAEEMADAQIKKLKEPAPAPQAPGAPQKSEPDKATAEAMLVIQKSLIKLEMREPVTKTDVEAAVSAVEGRVLAEFETQTDRLAALPAAFEAAGKQIVEAMPKPAEPFDPATILNAVNNVPSRLTETVVALAQQAAEARDTSETDEIAAKTAEIDRKQAEIEAKLASERLVTDQVLTASLKRGIDALAAREAKGIFGSREQPRTLPEWRTEFYAQLRRHFLHDLADLVPAAASCGVTLDLQWGADRYSQASISDLKTLDAEALDNNYDAVKAKTDEFVKHLWSERSQVLAVEMISRGRQEKHDAA